MHRYPAAAQVGLEAVRIGVQWPTCASSGVRLRAERRRARGEAMRMGALLHNGFVGWLLLLAVGQRTPRAGRERERRLGRGPVSSPAPTTAGAARGACGGFEAASTAHF